VSSSKKVTAQRHGGVFGIPKIVSARCQRPGEQRICDVRAFEYARMFLFGDNVEVDELDEPVEIGSQCANLRRFSQLTLASNPTVFHFRAPMIRYGTSEILRRLSQGRRKKLANPPDLA
jgi:hypothetical protein